MHKILWFWSAIFWTLTITLLSLVKISSTPKLISNIPGSDKYVHFTFYFVFTLLWSTYYFKKVKPTVKTDIIYKVFFIAITYGGIIEILQNKITQYRSADWYDFLANSSGSLIAAILLLIIHNKPQNKSNAKY